MSSKNKNEVEIPNKLLEEAISFYESRNYLIAIFSSLLIVTFVFTIINFVGLRTCQSNPSKGCPTLYPPTPETS